MPQWSKRLSQSIKHQFAQVSLISFSSYDYLTSRHMIVLFAFLYGVIVYVLENRSSTAAKEAQIPRTLKAAAQTGAIRSLCTLVALFFLPVTLHIIIPLGMAVSLADKLQKRFFKTSTIQKRVNQMTQSGATFAIKNGLKIAAQGVQMLSKT